MRSCLVCALALLASGSLLGSALAGQQPATPGATIAGRVTDAQSHAPLIGATVQVRGTELAVVTGQDGTYRIARVPRGAQTLTVRRLGYASGTMTVTVTADGVAQGDIALAQSAANLTQVVVTGTAGAQERITQPAVVASVDVAAIAKEAPVSNVTDVLEGRVPGLVVSEPSGVTGEGSKINIRGAASLSLSNEPLVFIDGVRVESEARGLVNTGGVNLTRGPQLDPLNELNPDDIESIEVVKGPAAATLYGADASAGVIQVITKKGAAGSRRLTQTFSAEYDGISPNFTPFTNYAQCPAGSTVPGPGAAFLCQGKTVGAVITDNPLVREGAFNNGSGGVFDYSLRGGGQDLGYFLSAGAANTAGTTTNNFLRRRSGRGNIDWSVTPKLRLTSSVSVIRQDILLPQEDQSNYGYMAEAIVASPLSVFKQPNGQLGGGFLLGTQSVDGLEHVRSEALTTRVTPSVQANYTPLSWFSNRFTLGADINRAEGSVMYPKNNNNWYIAGPEVNGQVQDVLDNPDTYTVDYLGTMSAKFGPNNGISSDFSFGSQFINRAEDISVLTGTGLTTNSSFLIGSNPSTSVAQFYNQSKSLGFFGQEQLGIADVLFLQIGARADQNSSSGNKAGTFFLPKGGISYVLSQEPFWRGISGVISTLRLRAAYGTTGRAPIPGASLTTYSPGPYVTAGGVEGSGLYPLNAGNPDLKPEKGTEFEAGVDASFFHDRAGIELTFYDKTTTNLLVQVPPAPSVGYPPGAAGNIFENIGEVRNQGLEFSVRATPIAARNFRWDATFEGSTLSNKVVSLGGVPPFISSYREFAPGYQLAAFFANKIEKVDLANKRVIVSDTAVFLGNQFPAFQGTVNTSVTLFRNLRVSALFTSKTNYFVYNLTQEYRDRYLQTSRDVVLNQAGQPGGYSALDYLRRFGPYFTASGASVPFTQVKEDYFQPGDYIRFQELSGTLTLPHGLVRAMHVTDAAITVGARNLQLWTKYKGYDPEILGLGPGRAGDSFYAQFFNADVFSTPPVRTWIARLNLTL